VELYGNTVVTTNVTILAKKVTTVTTSTATNKKYICAKHLIQTCQKKITSKVICQIISCLFPFVAGQKLTPRTSSVLNLQ
jgi:hypothetical protein